jgi:hypothetical protein
MDLMYSKSIDDECIPLIEQLAELSSLNVSHTKISPQGAARLARKESLRALHAAGLGITDSTVPFLMKSKTISRLNLSDSSITDKALTMLLKMESLRFLQIANCKRLTQTAIDKFIEARPDCSVTTYHGVKPTDL